MFQTSGTCWHTGYRPDFHTTEPEEVIRDIPRAVKRMQRWVDEYRDKHKKEDEAKQ